MLFAIFVTVWGFYFLVRSVNFICFTPSKNEPIHRDMSSIFSHQTLKIRRFYLNILCVINSVEETNWISPGKWYNRCNFWIKMCLVHLIICISRANNRPRINNEINYICGANELNGLFVVNSHQGESKHNQRQTFISDIRLFKFES